MQVFSIGMGGPRRVAVLGKALSELILEERRHSLKFFSAICLCSRNTSLWDSRNRRSNSMTFRQRGSSCGKHKHDIVLLTSSKRWNRSGW